MNLDHLETSQTLLEKAQNWEDHRTWNEMFVRYAPLLERWSQKWLCNKDDAAELNQQIWLEVAQRIQTFRYDSRGSFRAWLKTIHRCRVQDFLKRKSRETKRLQKVIDDIPLIITYTQEITLEDNAQSDEIHEVRDDPILNRMRKIQAKVQSRVQAKSWEIYWLIIVDGKSIKEISASFGMSYAATFAAFNRVGNMLREESLKE